MPEDTAHPKARIIVRRVVAGRIEALLYPGSATAVPDFELRQSGTFLAPVTVGPPEEGGALPLSVEIPVSVISDGISVLEIGEVGQEMALAHVTIIAGEPLRDDLHSEVAALRAELAQIRSFLRRHARGER